MHSRRDWRVTSGIVRLLLSLSFDRLGVMDSGLMNSVSFGSKCWEGGQGLVRLVLGSEEALVVFICLGRPDESDC